MTMGMSKTTLARVIGASNSVNIPAAVAALLQSKGGSLLLPGPNGTLRYGFQPGVYVESTGGESFTATDGAAGLVIDAAGTLGASAGIHDLLSWSVNNASSITATGFSTAGIGGLSLPTPLTVGKVYEITVSGLATGSAVSLVNALSSSPVIATLNGATQTIRWRAVNQNLYLRAAGTTVVTGVSIQAVEVGGVHASQATTQYKPALKSVGGTFCLRFDADDILSLTYPAGWGSSTVVTARATGAVTQTAQNLVGAQTITGAGDWYGRLAFPSALTAGELSLVQSFANTLSGYAP